MKIVIINWKDVDSVNEIESLEELQDFCDSLITKNYWYRWLVFDEIDTVGNAIVQCAETLNEYKSKHGKDDEEFCNKAMKLCDILSEAYNKLVEAYNKDLYDD